MFTIEMDPIGLWKEKAIGLREQARHERDAGRRQALLAKADACDELAADLEANGLLEKRPGVVG